MATDYYDLMNTITESALRIDFSEDLSDQSEEQSAEHQPRVPAPSADLTQDLKPEQSLSSAANILRDYLFANRSDREVIRNTLEVIFGPLSDTTAYTLYSSLTMQQSLEPVQLPVQGQTEKTELDMKEAAASETEASESNDTITAITETSEAHQSESAIVENSEEQPEEHPERRTKNSLWAFLRNSSKEEEIEETSLNEETFIQEDILQEEVLQKEVRHEEFIQEEMNLIPLDEHYIENHIKVHTEIQDQPHHLNAINDDDNPLQNISAQHFSDESHLRLDSSIDTTFTKTAATTWAFDFQYF